MTWIVIYTNSFVLQIYQHQQISVKKISTTTPTTTKLHKLICVTNISTATNLQKQIYVTNISTTTTSTTKITHTRFVINISTTTTTNEAFMTNVVFATSCH